MLGRALLVLLMATNLASCRRVHVFRPEKRVYHRVVLADLATTHFTDVVVQGTVSKVYWEEDGDRHIHLRDSLGHQITAECIPSLPCPAPAVGDIIDVYGISRLEPEYGFVPGHDLAEIHPVEHWVLVKKKGS